MASTNIVAIALPADLDRRRRQQEEQMHRKHELERLIWENDEELFPEEYPQDRVFGELDRQYRLAMEVMFSAPPPMENFFDNLSAEPATTSSLANRGATSTKETRTTSAMVTIDAMHSPAAKIGSQADDKELRWLRPLWVSSLLILASCLAWNAGPSRIPVVAPAAVAQQTRIIKPIEQIHVGDVAEVNLPPEAMEEALGDDTEYDSATWQRIKLRMQKPDGSLLHMELLRPVDWVEFYEAEVGQQIELSMPELGAEGLAEVMEIGPGPLAEAGRGRVVTGTFRHESAEVLDLTLSDGTTIGTTAMHP